MKKITLTLLALVVALFCAFGMAACDVSGSKVVQASCTVSDSNVFKVLLKNNGSTFETMYVNGQGKSAEVRKGNYTIHVELRHTHGLGTIKMHINDTEAPLTYKETSNNPNANYDRDLFDSYEYEGYNATEDFKISITGAVEKKAVNIHFEDISNKTSDWREGLNVFSLQVRILINGNTAAAPFDNSGTSNSIPLETFLEAIADNDLAVKADDHVDIYVFSTLGDQYKIWDSVLGYAEGNRALPSKNYDGNQEDNDDYAGQKGQHYSFDIKDLEMNLAIDPGAIRKIN